MTNSEEREIHEPRTITLTVATSDGEPVHIPSLTVTTTCGPVSIPVRHLLLNGDTLSFSDELRVYK